MRNPANRCTSDGYHRGISLESNANAHFHPRRIQFLPYINSSKTPSTHDIYGRIG
jgi:hypothetical protein